MGSDSDYDVYEEAVRNFESEKLKKQKETAEDDNKYEESA